MYFKRRIFYFFLILLFPFSLYAQENNTQNLFPDKLTLNGQEWRLGFHDINNEVQLAEYVTGTETVENWTQLVTFQKFKFVFNKNVTPEKFAIEEITPLKNDPKYQIYFKVIEASPKEAIMEFRVNQPKTEQQDEIQRIIKTPSSHLIVLHYVVNKADMGDDARDRWIKTLKNIDIDFLMKDEDDLAKLSGQSFTNH